MTDKTATDLLATIKDIAEESKNRFGIAPPRAYVSTVMKNRIIGEIAAMNLTPYIATRRQARDGLKIIGIRFMVDYRMPDDEIHFCTKRREVMVRVKVDQQPMAEPPHPACHTPLEAEEHKSAHPYSPGNAGALGAANPSAQTVPTGTAS